MMDGGQGENSNTSQNPTDEESRSAVNSLILDYYKKFGRKRDLEQYFSLSTAQSDIRDPTSLFWARMKAENETSSDSGERSDKKSESSQELCRISIRFPAQDPCSSQDEETKTKTESVSPPIIIEELPHDSRQNSDDEAMKSDDGAKSDDDVKSDDNNSQKSFDVLLDTSLNKLHSPSSSITSQRRLEWDSLADVGYANESDRKTSASSLSTLERLALKQQYSNNDTQQNSNLGMPTAQSTPLDENEPKSKLKKGVGKKTTKIYKKDVDVVEVSVPHSSNMNPTQSINVNLTKHISFNVEKDGKVIIDNIHKDMSVSPEKSVPEVEIPALKFDRDVQTSLPKIPSNVPEKKEAQQKIPILISLNTLKSRVRRRRLRMARRKQKAKKRQDKENIPVQEKSGEQLSEAESFEYMPGHIYNQNQMTANNNNNGPNDPDNKSSLESSGVLTSDSSKGSKHSFTKDLEKSIDLLRAALKKRCDDSALRKQLIQQVCQRLLNSQYRDDDSTTDFLSGLSFSSKKLGLGEQNNTTTSTSENNSAENTKRPKKSILRSEKFNAGPIASTSQSVPNLPIASNSEHLVTSSLTKNLTTTESDVSSKNNTSSDNGLTKTSSEELYKKYLQALKREEAYKKHLKDKEMFLKQKLVASDNAFKVPLRVEVKPSTASSRLKDLIHDLTRNNYDDGSGDASKLEGGPSSHSGFDRIIPNRNQRSHSVFTLSSGHSEQNKKTNLKKRLQSDLKDFSKPGTSKDAHYCCCPHHGSLKLTDSSVQVNIKKPCNLETCPEMQKKEDKKPLGSPRKLAKIIADDATGNLEYVCLCNKTALQDVSDDFLIYKCSRLTNKGIQLGETSSKSSTEAYVQCNDTNCPKKVQPAQNKSSQTDMLIKMMNQLPNNLSSCCNPSQKESDGAPLTSVTSIYESTRWIQTEISINPKIAEPTLSDTNIVSDTNCAKLICENRREVSKPSITDLFSTQAIASSSTALSSSNKSTGSSKGAAAKFYDSNSTPRSNNSNPIPISNVEHIEHTEKFTIPIQGTNMTLMVSLGSEQTLNNPFHKYAEMVNQGIGTEKVQAIEQATSVLDECSRGVQANDNRNPVAKNFADVNSNQVENQNTVGVSGQSRNVFLSGNPKPQVVNTYPKVSLVNEEKPLRRANTDVEKHHYHVAFSDVEEQNTNPSKSYTKVASKCSKIRPPESSTDIHDMHVCTCGCNGKIEVCKLQCVERKFMISNKMSREAVISTHEYSDHEIKGDVGNNDERKLSLKNPLECKASSYNAMSPAHTEKCSCGCGGAKNMCKRSCKEATKREIGTQSVEQATIQKLSGPIPTTKSSTTSSYFHEKNKTCSCGCGGTIDKCKKRCPERAKMTDAQIETGPCVSEMKLPRHSVTSNYFQEEENKTCTCGCGGTVDKCKKKCPERAKTTDVQIETGPCVSQVRLPRHSVTSNYFQEEDNKSCSCGCGGTIDKCKKRCPERAKTRDTQIETGPCVSEIKLPRHSVTSNYFEEEKNKPCSCGCGGTVDKCKKRCPERAKMTDTQTETGPCISQITIPTVKSSTSNYYQEEKTRTCSCGCGGTLDNCKKRCPERARSSDIQTETGPCLAEIRLPLHGLIPSEREMETQTDKSITQSERCSCGCGFTKDKCNISCHDRKIPCQDRKKSIPYRRYSSPRRESNISQDRRGSSPGRIESRVPQYRRASSPRQEESRISQSKRLSSPKTEESNNLQHRRISSPRFEENNVPQYRRLSSPRMDGNNIPQYRKLSSPNRRLTEENRTPKSSRESSPTLAGNRNYLSGRDSSPRKQEDKAPQYRRLSSPSQRHESPRQVLKKHSDAQTSSENTESEGCRRRPTDCDMNTQTDPFNPIYDLCPCGCGNPKSSCKGSCSQQKSSPRNDDAEIRRSQPLALNLNLETGCSTTDCPKLTPRDPIKNIIVNTAQGFPDSYKESCPCGCGRSKDKCSKTCKERKPSPRDGNGNEIGIQKDREDTPPTSSRSKRSASPLPLNAKSNSGVDSSDPTEATSSSKGKKSTTDTDPTDSGSDPIINMIQNITKKYAKKDVEKNKRKKCFKEIMTVLNYLLETEDDPGERTKDKKNTCVSSTSNDETDACGKKTPEKEKLSKKVDRGVQPSAKKKPKQCGTESSEPVTSTEIPGTSSDSATCKVLNKIKKECDKYHQKRCKTHCGKNCDGTSSTSNCEKCRRVHQCQCRSHKCKSHRKSAEKIPKTSVAYNLILQTSESIMSDGPSSCCEKTRQLKNIIVKVPKKKVPACTPFGEIAAKFERKMPPCNIHCNVQKERTCRSRSCPNESEISSLDEILRKSQGATVREYLEKNRPDFIEKCNERQTCMRYISESRATERAAKRDLLSMHMAQLPDVTELEGDDLMRLASELGRYMRQKQPPPKFINEREMKKHSEKIYKSLPEVVLKKEEQKKENNRRTNLLMANIFKRNLQKKTLRGSVNISNYSSVIKI